MKRTIKINIEVPEGITDDDLFEFIHFELGTHPTMSMYNQLSNLELSDLIGDSYNVDID